MVARGEGPRSPFAALAALAPMEARLVPELPKTGEWRFEPKGDSFRCLAFRDGAVVQLRAKSGKPLGRFLPEVTEALQALATKRFLLDGELIIPVGSHLSFEALQMRLHPAQSRVLKLSRQTPALYMVFDLLAEGAKRILECPLSERRLQLESFLKRERHPAILRLSPYATDVRIARQWLKRAGGGALDGVVAKPLGERYRAGERTMLKVKCLRTADCVVGGFRYATHSRQVGSLLLGLFSADGQLDHIGFTSALSDKERPALTRRLEALRGGVGFTGNAPGAPSRWTKRSTAWLPLKPKLVVEVEYDQVTANRFRHGTRLKRWRPDKAPIQCTKDQLVQEARPSKVLEAVWPRRRVGPTGAATRT